MSPRAELRRSEWGVPPNWDVVGAIESEMRGAWRQIQSHRTSEPRREIRRQLLHYAYLRRLAIGRAGLLDLNRPGRLPF